MQILVHKEINNSAKMCIQLCQTYNRQLKIISKKGTNILEASGKSVVRNTAWTISCKARNYSVKYPSWEYKSDMKESDGNVFIPTFWMTS